MGFITQWDFSVLDAIASHHIPFLDRFFSTVTHFADCGILWIILSIILLFFPKSRKLGLCIALALILDLFICNICLKPLIHRIRPYELRTVALLITAPADPSFPSGHSAASFAAVTPLILRKSKLAIPSVIIALLISFSRLYLYLHFPTDVLAGIMIGIICGILACNIEKKLKFGKK